MNNKFDVKQLVLQTIKKYNMLDGVQNVFVGLSGGADSTALTHILSEVSNDFGFKLFAIHINHCLRGAESDEDERFCKQFCDDLGIVFYSHRIDIKMKAADNKTGIEETARNERYRIFNEYCNKYEKSVIATAHNLNDLAETVILNITRGSSVRGLSGIPPVRNKIIRPLLDVPRKAVEQYCEENSLCFVTDSTNLSDDYSRNKVRHNILPVLEQLNPEYLSAFHRICDDAAATQQHLDKLLDCIGEPDAQQLITFDDFTIRGYLHRFIELQTGICCERVHIDAAEAVLHGKYKRCQLPGCFYFEITKGRPCITTETHDEAVPYKISLSPGIVETPYNRYDIKVMTAEEYVNILKFNKKLFKNTLDYDKISENTFIRSRLQGDKIKLFKRGCTKTIKKLYSESSVPEYMRNRLALIASDSEVYWAEGFGVSETAAVSSSTRKYLVLFMGDDFN